MDNIVKKECQKDVINLLQEKEYNEDGVRMFFRNFVNIEVEKQLKDEVNKYKEKGYNILKVGNTESKVKQTKITNRTKQASEKVTEVKNVIKETAKTETGKDTEDVDFTITIGQDY